jgi:hypothetical protein
MTHRTHSHGQPGSEEKLKPLAVSKMKEVRSRHHSPKPRHPEHGTTALAGRLSELSRSACGNVNQWLLPFSRAM